MKMLCLIDVQKQYTSSINLRLNRNLKKVIKQYKDEQHPIMIVEYPYYTGPKATKTHNWIQKLLRDYPLRIDVIKDDNDGSDEILEKLSLKGIDATKIELHLAGVNYSICVSETFHGLVAKQCTVKVIKPACNDYGNGNVFSKQHYYGSYPPENLINEL